MKAIAITTGDQAGIGPEVVSKGLNNYQLDKHIAYIVYGTLLTEFLNVPVRHIKEVSEITEGGLIYHIQIEDEDVLPGIPSIRSGEIAYQILQRVISDIKLFRIPAILTGPVSKINLQHIDSRFIGHTELFAHEFNVDNYIMSFHSPVIDIALLTTHTPLCEVNKQLTLDLVVDKLRLIAKYAHRKNPKGRIALLGLNPHCGEDGLFGNEERIFEQAIEILRMENIAIEGPFPADSFFKYRAKKYKQVIAAYHDQGLIPFKMLAGETGVNVTLGLPFIRTSVDHGTAFDIAGKGIASEVSFVNALELTEKLLKG